MPKTWHPNTPLNTVEFLKSVTRTLLYFARVSLYSSQRNKLLLLSLSHDNFR
ncbi:hypothetical protein ACB092_02G033100 [Castanea dentata]